MKYLSHTLQSVLWIAANSTFGKYIKSKPKFYATRLMYCTERGDQLIEKFGKTEGYNVGYTEETLYGEEKDVPHDVLRSLRAREPALFKDDSL